MRTGLSKVGIPGAPVGQQDRDITIAQALKALGCATGQFGKNHLGDRDQYLPTAHGFDEFFGNLYHLNAEGEPEGPYYPKNDTNFVKTNSPCGVLHSFAGGKVQDTGPLNRKRMETIDDETTSAAIGFIEKQAKAGKPFFVWMNTTRMHLFTHIRESMRGQSGMPGNDYADGMIEHDGDVGKLLKAMDDLKIADDTIVVYTTDNGPNQLIRKRSRRGTRGALAVGAGMGDLSALPAPNPWGVTSDDITGPCDCRRRARRDRSVRGPARLRRWC